MKRTVLSEKFMNGLVAEAGASSRHRQYFNIHTSFTDPCQRLINAINVGSYIQPHNHKSSSQDELLIALRGCFAKITFCDGGDVLDLEKFGTERFSTGDEWLYGVEISPRVWHTVIALTHDALLLEVKRGPFCEETAKNLAPWAPAPGSEYEEQYVESLYRLCEVDLNKLKVKRFTS